MKRMNTNNPNWKKFNIEAVLSLEYGKSFPESKRLSGPYAVYGSNGIVGRSDKFLLGEPTIIIGRKGSAGEINLSESCSWPIDTTYYVSLKSPLIYSLHFIYYFFKWLDPRRFIDTTTKPGLNRDRIYAQEIALPPFPVQERIVQILQKADSMRQKRQKAEETISSILPSLFFETFGDPTKEPTKFKKISLGEITTLVTSGYTPRGGASVYVPDGPLLIRSQNVRMLQLDLSDCAHIPENIHAEMSRVQVLPGDVLLNITGASIGRVTWADEDIPPANVNQHVCVIRVKKNLIVPEYLAFLLASPWYQHIILNAPGSAQSGFNHSRVRGLEILLPPLPIQNSFVLQVKNLQKTKMRLENAFSMTNDVYNVLLARAFSGELTADWELANAKEIVVENTVLESLPRLVLLAFLREKSLSVLKKTLEKTILVTALMKYAFLFQMENMNQRKLYNFVPYHYGPFAKDLYEDLEALQADGFISIDNVEEDKTRISIDDSVKVDAALKTIPSDILESVSEIFSNYGNLPHNALLERVYEKYPSFAVKSRLRKKKKTDVP